MKKIIKIIPILLILILLTGCGKEVTPTNKVEDLFNRYINLDSSILSELNTYISSQNLTDEQKSKYKEIIKNEYSTLTYEIMSETINEDSAIVEVKISVNDLFKPSIECEDKLRNDPSFFYTDGVYDSNKYVDYKLELMASATDKVDYTLEINLTKEDDTWKVSTLDSDTLKKIHGIYNYTEN